MIAKKQQDLLVSVTRLTKNVEDAKDAIQGAYLYQLTRGLKRKHFMWKTFNLAKDAYRAQKRSNVVLWAFGGQEDDTDVIASKAHTRSAHSALEAKDECRALRASLSPANQRIFDALLAHDSVAEAVAATGITKTTFTTFINRVRKGEIGCAKKQTN